MSQLKLITAKICPFAQRSLLVACEKELQFDHEIIDLKEKPDWFLELSPTGKVPLILHDGHIIYESLIINEYLDEVFNEQPLMEKDPLHKAQMRLWMSYCDTKFIKAFYSLIRSEKNERDKSLTLLEKEILYIDENAFKKSSYIYGESLSLVDFAFFPFFMRFCVISHFFNYSIPSASLKLNNWIKLMSAKESVKKCRQEDAFYIKAYEKYLEINNP